MTYSSFRPGALWLDTEGVPINAHGGGLLYAGDTYYWFGEFKTEGPRGNRAWEGVSCYASTDLYNWRNQGIVLPVVHDDPDHDLIEGCVIERPKVIYNAKQTATSCGSTWNSRARATWRREWAWPWPRRRQAHTPTRVVSAPTAKCPGT